jgi:hypothetical protein
VLEQQAEHDRRNRDHRPDRQVDLARHQHERGGHREDTDDRDLRRDVREVVDVRKRRVDQREHHADQHDREHHSDLAEQL